MQKKDNWSAKIGRIWEEEKYIFSSDLIMHDFGIFF